MNKMINFSVLAFAFILPYFAFGGELDKRTDQNGLTSLIAGEYQENSSVMSLAKETIKRVYEMKPRHIESSEEEVSKYGYSYPIDPEVLAYVMKKSNEKTVLEVAAAAGENSLLIGLAGAKEVYVNDREPVELKKFKNAIKKLPPGLQQKFKTCEGDFFTLFDDKKFEGKFDIIYARNFLHFFAGKKRTEFINLAKRLLSKGSKLVVSVNSRQALGINFDEEDDSYVFFREAFTVKIPNGDEEVFLKFSNHPNPDKADPLKHYFKEFDYNVLSKEGKKVVRGQIKRGVSADQISDECLCNDIVLYSDATLERFLEANDLKVVETFKLARDGHTTSDPQEENHVGAIATFS